MYKLKEGVTQIRHFLSMINGKQVTLYLYLTKNHAMKAYQRLQELDGGQWSPSYPGYSQSVLNAVQCHSPCFFTNGE